MKSKFLNLKEFVLVLLLACLETVIGLVAAMPFAANLQLVYFLVPGLTGLINGIIYVLLIKKCPKVGTQFIIPFVYGLLFLFSGSVYVFMFFAILAVANELIMIMEITFENGKTLTKAITVSLLEDGTFFAKFDDYEITAEDSFIDRPDSKAIGAAPVIEDNYKEADPNEPEQIVIPNSITFTGTIIDNVIESLVPIILVDVEENSGLSYDKVLFELTEEQKDWELKIGTRVQIVCSDIFQESTPPIGNLISITEAAPNDELKIADEAARAYYENTVFEVISLKLKSQTENGISFSVCVSKGGIVQEPDRTIFLEFVNGHWEVVNEGY